MKRICNAVADHVSILWDRARQRSRSNSVAAQVAAITFAALALGFSPPCAQTLTTIKKAVDPVSGAAITNAATFTSSALFSSTTLSAGELSSFAPIVAPSASFPTGSANGDGFRPILVGGEVSEVFHRGASGSEYATLINQTALINCQNRTTGAVCPGYPKLLLDAAGGNDFIATPTFVDHQVVGTKIYDPALKKLNNTPLPQLGGGPAQGGTGMPAST